MTGISLREGIALVVIAVGFAVGVIQAWAVPGAGTGAILLAALAVLVGMWIAESGDTSHQ